MLTAYSACSTKETEHWSETTEAHQGTLQSLHQLWLQMLQIRRGESSSPEAASGGVLLKEPAAVLAKVYSTLCSAVVQHHTRGAACRELPSYPARVWQQAEVLPTISVSSGARAEGHFVERAQLTSSCCEAFTSRLRAVHQRLVLGCCSLHNVQEFLGNLAWSHQHAPHFNHLHSSICPQQE